MPADDAKTFCQGLLRDRVAQHQYDVQKFERSADGGFYQVELTSPEGGMRTVYLTILEEAVRKTYQDGELAEAIVRNLDDALRHLRVA